MSSELKHHKVDSLPSTLIPGSVYYVSDGVGTFSTHIVDKMGFATKVPSDPRLMLVKAMFRMKLSTELEADAGITTKKGRKTIRKLLRKAARRTDLKAEDILIFNKRIKALSAAINA